MRRLVTGRLLTLAGLLFILQSAGFPFVSLFGAGRIDLFYLLVLDYAFFYNAERVPYFALGVGLFRDFSGGHFFGIETAGLTVTGLLLYLGTQKLEREDFLIRGILIFLFTLLSELISMGLGTAIETSQGLARQFVGGIFWTAVYTTAFAPAFFWFTQRWFGRRPAFKQYELFHS